MDFVAPQLMKPIPLSTVLFVSKFDISSMGKVLTARDGRSIVEKMEAIKKVRRIASFTLLYKSFL